MPYSIFSGSERVVTGFGTVAEAKRWVSEWAASEGIDPDTVVVVYEKAPRRFIGAPVGGRVVGSPRLVEPQIVTDQIEWTREPVNPNFDDDIIVTYDSNTNTWKAYLSVHDLKVTANDKFDAAVQAGVQADKVKTKLFERILIQELGGYYMYSVAEGRIAGNSQKLRQLTRDFIVEITKRKADRSEYL